MDQADGKISLTSFIILFLQTAIDNESKGKFMSTICSFYTEFLESLYGVFKTVEQDNSKMPAARGGNGETQISEEEDKVQNGAENAEKPAGKNISHTAKKTEIE